MTRSGRTPIALSDSVQRSLRYVLFAIPYFDFGRPLPIVIDKQIPRSLAVFCNGLFVRSSNDRFITMPSVRSLAHGFLLSIFCDRWPLDTTESDHFNRCPIVLYGYFVRLLNYRFCRPLFDVVDQSFSTIRFYDRRSIVFNNPFDSIVGRPYSALSF